MCVHGQISTKVLSSPIHPLSFLTSTPPHFSPHTSLPRSTKVVSSPILASRISSQMNRQATSLDLDPTATAAAVSPTGAQSQRKPLIASMRGMSMKGGVSMKAAMSSKLMSLMDEEMKSLVLQVWGGWIGEG